MKRKTIPKGVVIPSEIGSFHGDDLSDVLYQMSMWFRQHNKEVLEMSYNDLYKERKSKHNFTIYFK
jgi:hypothetical protein